MIPAPKAPVMTETGSGGSSGPDPACALSARDVTCTYGGVTAVRSVSLEVAAGQRLGLIGPNGAGKTTFINGVTGNVRLRSGSVHLFGTDITRLGPHDLVGRGLVRTFQQTSVFPALSVMENMLLGHRLEAPERSVTVSVFQRRKWRAAEAAQVRQARRLLSRFGIDRQEDDRAGSLSGGQKRLLELARALMAGPRLLVLDEPMAGVARPLVEVLIHHLLEVADSGVTLIVVEHDMSVIERLCDRVAVMALGEIVAQGTMAEIRADEAVQRSYLGGER